MPASTKKLYRFCPGKANIGIWARHISSQKFFGITIEALTYFRPISLKSRLQHWLRVKQINRTALTRCTHPYNPSWSAFLDHKYVTMFEPPSDFEPHTICRTSLEISHGDLSLTSVSKRISRGIMLEVVWPLWNKMPSCKRVDSESSAMSYCVRSHNTSTCNPPCRIWAWRICLTEVRVDSKGIFEPKILIEQDQ